MLEKPIERVVDGIRRKIIAETDGIKTLAEFYEDEELQMIIKFPEDVINMTKSKFRSRKYSFIFDYYLDNGIQNLVCGDIESMLNTSCIGCSVEFVFHNKDGIDIKDSGSCTHSFTASYQETINGVLFEFKKDIYGDFKYHEVNEICKKGETGIKVYWSRNILHKSYSNKYGERCVTVKVNGVPYSMLEVMFDRINSDDYLYKRNFFKKGSTLFNKETTRLLTKHIMLNRQREIFIKYVDFDGTAIF